MITIKKLAMQLCLSSAVIAAMPAHLQLKRLNQVHNTIW